MRGRRGRLLGVALLCAAGVCLSAGRAGAYLRFVTSDGLPFAWPQTCVPVTVYPNDLTDLAPAQTMHAVSAAAAAWSAGANACTFLDITTQASTDPARRAGYDGNNVVVFLRDSFCRATDPPGSCSYDPSALAITSVFVSSATGQIRDADIEVNAKYFAWTDVDTDPAPAGKHDLQDALTHEMGHLIGLADTCVVPGAFQTRPLDNLGQPVPDCDMASPAVQATTMFPSSLTDDTTRRTLAPDDTQGLCDIYPVAMNPMVCPPAGGADVGAGDGGGAATDANAPDGGGAAQDAAPDAGASAPPASGCGCDVGERSPAPAGGAALLAALALLAGARRRPRAAR
jgi:MYXO-CTERM domain-containing protein